MVILGYFYSFLSFSSLLEAIVDMVRIKQVIGLYKIRCFSPSFFVFLIIIQHANLLNLVHILVSHSFKSEL